MGLVASWPLAGGGMGQRSQQDVISELIRGAESQPLPDLLDQNVQCCNRAPEGLEHIQV